MDLQSVISESGSMVLSLIGQSQRKKENKKDRIIIESPPVLCECGVKANYGLVPSELGIGHWCGHMVDYDEVGYYCGKHETKIFFCEAL